MPLNQRCVSAALCCAWCIKGLTTFLSASRAAELRVCLADCRLVAAGENQPSVACTWATCGR